MTRDQEQPAPTFASIGIDIGKDVFHVVGFDTFGKVVGGLPCETIRAQ